MVGFVVPIEVRLCEDPQRGQGVFATVDIASGTLVWTPTLLSSWSPEEARKRLAAMPFQQAHECLRHSFVAPAAPECLQLNPDDDGRFTNHSANPNIGACEDPAQGSQALRDIAAGDELVCDYSVFACPEWYQALCMEYNVLTTAAVVSRFG